MSKPANIQIRMSPDLEARLDHLRVEPGEPLATTVRNALDQLATILLNDLRSVRHEFTLPELQAMASVVTGTFHDALSRTLLVFEVEDAVEGGDLDDILPRADGRQLATKLHNLSPGQAAAITHALQRWWALPAGERLTTSEGFARVGLIAQAT